VRQGHNTKKKKTQWKDPRRCNFCQPTKTRASCTGTQGAIRSTHLVRFQHLPKEGCPPVHRQHLRPRVSKHVSVSWWGALLMLLLGSPTPGRSSLEASFFSSSTKRALH
jgi:hypothetical protein